MSSFTLCQQAIFASFRKSKRNKAKFVSLSQKKKKKKMTVQKFMCNGYRTVESLSWDDTKIKVQGGSSHSVKKTPVTEAWLKEEALPTTLGTAAGTSWRNTNTGMCQGWTYWPEWFFCVFFVLFFFCFVKHHESLVQWSVLQWRLLEQRQKDKGNS